MEFSGNDWSSEDSGETPGVPPRREHLVVIGNGMAGCRAVEELLARDAGRYRLTIFGAEPHVNYNRIMLSPVLAGEKTFDEIILNTHDWYRDNGIELIAGDAVVAIDRAGRRVTAASGRSVDYDRLLIATGSDPFIIPCPGHTLDGVISFRDMHDVDRMLAAADRGGDAVVIGGGLLGLEAAHGLSLRGMKVTVLHLMQTLMERQLDEAAGWLLKTALETRGQTILTGADTAEILDDGNGKVRGVLLKDGTVIPASIVVMAVGIRPNVRLAREAGLAVGRGIQVDDHMVTSDPAILAVGECVEHDGNVYGLVAPLFDMCRSLADGLVERPSGYRGSVTSTKLKVAGLDVFSAGDFSGGDGAEDIVLRDASRGVYKRVVLRDDRVIGAVLYGDTADGGWYFDLLKKQEDVSDLRDVLIFGQAFASGGGQADPKAAVAALSDDAEICGCNGVTKGQVVACIGKGASSLDAVRAGCKASASCGSCTGLVETLLALTLGDEVEAGPRTMCKCTSFGHDDVRREIVAQDMRSIPEVMHKLHWGTPDGCASCRPALNYYLLCALPGDYVDDQQSRFVNERMHANIQKDGTYSVVPRMWGGITSPRELRAIADVVEKFNAPMVKVTGGQRLDIFGIRKEDLPAVWADLNAAGMVSGHAYGKSLRTVKTCVGSEWCRFGTQDSTGLGVRIERMTWGSWMPHKFKIAVSGCPRNCAEATIKDFGIVCVDSGYELSVGGNGGIKVRATDFLCKVATEAEAMHYCAAFVQLYREEARYLERTAPWIERVGVDYIKARIVEDDEGRDALAERFLYSQSFSQDDPWAERAAGVERIQHSHMAEFHPQGELA
ncbi:nitrite reductase large subunit NirB [Sphingomonas sp. HF-S3]|uniref:Nitrite reductase large subunit NirB n=1 Tax=Sphingomonas rustica TaxID=3103142 RepID=A0ABV0B4L1_9SPHN